MIKHPIKDLVNESFLPPSYTDETVMAYYKKYKDPSYTGTLSFEDYFETKRLDLLKGLWKDTFFTKSPTPYSKLYRKMSLTKHISEHPSNIGKDKTFYFLGKRYTKVHELKKVCAHYNWTQIQDATKADFFVVGESVTEEEASLNMDLSKPVVMDESIRVHFHFLFNTSNKSVDQNTVATFLNSGDFGHFKLVMTMIQYLDEDALNSENKYRLIRAFARAFIMTKFDARDKEHKWISDTAQKYCHPFHRALVTRTYLCNRKTSTYVLRSFNGNSGLGWIAYRDNAMRSYNYNYSNYSEQFEFIHMSEGQEKVTKDDIVSQNRYSIVPESRFSRPSDYISAFSSTFLSDQLHLVTINIKGHNNLSFYANKVKGDYDILGCGLSSSDYSRSSEISKSMFHYVHKDRWESNYDTVIIPLVKSILSRSTMDSPDFLVIDPKDIIDLALQLDELITSMRIHATPFMEFLEQARFQRRKTSILNL